MKIYIPSRGRAALCRTWQGLPPTWQAHAVHVVPTSEADAYRAQSLPIAPCPVPGIGATRQWICDRHNINRDGASILMLDDDLEFFSRRRDDKTKLVKATTQSITRMLETVDEVSRVHPHGGIATREGANRNVERWLMDERCLRALFYNVATLRAHSVRFDRLPVMEDFDVALQLLRLGFHSCKVNLWAQDQPGSNTAGGCSEYRTAAVQAQGAMGLAALHPKFVTVVDKEPLKSGGWSGQPRKDVRISWKAAYNAG